MSSSAAAGAEQEPEVEFEALRGSAGRGELASHKPPAQAALRLGAPSFAGEHLDLGSPLFSFSPLQPRAVSLEQHTWLRGAWCHQLPKPQPERRQPCLSLAREEAVLHENKPQPGCSHSKLSWQTGSYKQGWKSTFRAPG